MGMDLFEKKIQIHFGKEFLHAYVMIGVLQPLL